MNALNVEFTASSLLLNILKRVGKINGDETIIYGRPLSGAEVTLRTPTHLLGLDGCYKAV